MKYRKFWKFLLCTLLLLSIVCLSTACNTAQPETDASVELPVELDEETKAAIELRTSIREVAAGMEESFNATTEDTTGFTVTLTMIESAEALIRGALERVTDELPEIQQEEVEAVLQQLYDAGILEEKAVYDLENMMFTYIYNGGILGGVHLQEPDQTRNTASSSSSQTTTPALNTNASNSLHVAILNGFEDTAYRRDYYETLQQDWSAAGIQVDLNHDVTISDLTNLAAYDVIVFSMHGSTYQNMPILAIDEPSTTESDLLYAKYLTEDFSIAKVLYLDGTSHYWVLPVFFSNCYGTDGLANKIVYSESCCFYGCDCYCSDVDSSFAQALLDADAEAVVGYYNSVSSDYSRDMMRATLESMFDGTTLDIALQNSIRTYGADDAWTEPLEDKYPAYPCVLGNADAVLTASTAMESPDSSAPEQDVPDETQPAEESSVVSGTAYPVDTTYIDGWPYVADGSTAVFFRPDSFYTESGQRTANVGFGDYLYLYDAEVSALQIGDTLQTADYLGKDIPVTSITPSGTDLTIHAEYQLSDLGFGVWLLCDASGGPISYPAVWQCLPITDTAMISSYSILDLDPAHPESIFSENPDVSSLLGYISISNAQITQIIFE